VFWNDRFARLGYAGPVSSHTVTESDAFIEAACVPLDGGHASGTLDRANEILTAHPEIATSSIHTAAILGDDVNVSRVLAVDPASATAKGGPRAWDALTHLCFSRYLRLDPARSAGLVSAARALLDAGASANTGFHEMNHQPAPEFESALYGAAGVAHHRELTRLLLERGANPNDGEVTYHTPESYDLGALEALVETGKLTPDSLATMLHRKADWHDLKGMTWLLERGADPNHMTRWGFTAIHQSIRRDNARQNIETILDHGGDATRTTRSDGRSSVALAARRGRGDLLELFERRGIRTDLRGVERLIAACARNDSASVHTLAGAEPELVGQLVSDGGRLLAEFAGNGNTGGVGLLLDLGVDVAARFTDGDAYWGIANHSTALHVAAWRARHATVRLLIERGAPVDVKDGRDRTPLALAVRASVDSFWTYLRAPDSVEALLRAGASPDGVVFPS
jgi:ankyrin repeat protein